MATNPLITHGAALDKPARYVPIFTNRFFTGLWTQRNPLRDAATPYLYEKFYSGSRYESLLGGSNCEISNRLTLCRRPGAIVYNSQSFPAINRFYSFRKLQGSNEQIQLIADTGTANGFIYDATGPNTKTAIFNKSASAGEAYFQSIGNILYFGDGAETAKYLNTTSGWTTQNWGIASGGGSAYSATAGAGTNGGGAGQAWTNPGNVTSAVSFAAVSISAPATAAKNAGTGTAVSWLNPENCGSTMNYATRTVPSTSIGVSDDLIGSQFGFSIPNTATINGVLFTFNAYHYSQFGGASIGTNQVQLYYSGSPIGTAKSVTDTWNSTGQNWNYGGSSDMWGAPLTAAIVNDPSFGARMNMFYDTSSGVNRGYVDAYQITVYYTVGSGPSYSQSLQASGFGFSVPSNLVPSGFSVTFDTESDGPSMQVQLMVGLTPVGTAKTVGPVGTSPVNISLGSVSDDWGTNATGGISASSVNGSGFGVQFVAGSGAGTAQVRNVHITVNVSGAPSVVPTGSGAMTVTKNLLYVYCYGNSLTAHVSNPTPAASTGPFTNKAYVAVTLAASSDPQVNQIRVFRTTDGGTSFLELPTSPYPNVTQTVNDAAGDPGSSVFPQLNPFSVAPTGLDNSPPPTSLVRLIYHNSRIWGVVGNTVYFSLPPNYNIGVGAESFPPTNTFVFPSAVIRLVPTSIGILVYTVLDIYVILGNGATIPYYVSIFCRNIGLSHYDAITEAGTEQILLSSTGECVRFDPSAAINALTGIPNGQLDRQQIGFPIGDVLQNSFDPTKAYVAWHVHGSLDQALYVADGSTGWYRWAISVMPEQSAAWSPFAQIVGGAGCVQSTEVFPGDVELLIGPVSSGPILKRSLTTWLDNGAAYNWYANVGNIVLAQPGQLAKVDFVTVDCNASNNGQVVGVSSLFDEISGSFQSYSNPVNDPVYLPPSTSILGKRYYFANPTPSVGRHVQLQFSGSAQNTADELLSYTIYGAIET